MEILNTKDSKLKFAKILVYGRSGAEKTRWVTTASNPLVLDLEKGLLSVKDRAIPYIEIKECADVKKAREFVTEKLKTEKEPLTLIIDSLTEMADQAKSYLEPQRHMDDARKLYPKVMETVLGSVRKFANLPCHLVLVCKEDTEERNGVTLSRLRMPGKTLAGELPYLLDVVLYMTKNEETGEKEIFSAMGTRFEAKDRSGRLPARFDHDLTLKDVINRVIGENNA